MTLDLISRRRAAVDQVLSTTEFGGFVAGTGSCEWTEPGDEARLPVYVEHPGKEYSQRHVLVVIFRPGSAEVYSDDIED